MRKSRVGDIISSLKPVNKTLTLAERRTIRKEYELIDNDKDKALPNLRQSMLQNIESKTKSTPMKPKNSIYKRINQNDRADYEFVPKTIHKSSERKDRSNANKETLEQKLKELGTPIKSDLIEYVKRNPKNMKVLRFLNKHFNIEYDVISNRWEVREEKGFENYRQRIKSFDDREEQKETVNSYRTLSNQSQANKDLSNQICQILNVIYESTKPNKAETKLIVSSPHEVKKNSFEEYQMFFK